MWKPLCTLVITDVIYSKWALVESVSCVLRSVRGCGRKMYTEFGHSLLMKYLKSSFCSLSVLKNHRKSWCILSAPFTSPVWACLFELLTVDGGDVVGQVGPRAGPGPLHEQLAIGAPVTCHEVVILGRACPGRRRKPEQPAVFQMLMGHCRGEREGEG